MAGHRRPSNPSKTPHRQASNPTQPTPPSTGRRGGSGRQQEFAKAPYISTLPPSSATRQTVLDPRTITINETAAGMLREPIFGPFTQGLKLLYANSFSSGTIAYLVAAISEGPIQTCTPLIDGVAMTNDAGSHWTARGGKFEGWFYDGSQNNVQEVTSGLFALDPTWITTNADPNKGYNYLAFWVFKWTWDPNLNTDLPKITFTGNGYRDCYDARTGTRIYSENPSVITREIFTNSRWGFKIPNNSTYFNDTPWQDSANDCDVAVMPAAPSAAPTATAGAAGNVSGNPLNYYVTNVGSGGVETLLGPASIGIVAINQQVNLTSVPLGDALTATRNIYRTDGSGQIRRVGSIANNTATTFTDNMSYATWIGQPLAPTLTPVNKRYSGGLHCARQAAALEWLHTIRAVCLGVITPENGRYEMRINKALAGGYVRKQFSEFHNWGGNNENPNVAPDTILWGRAKRSLVFNEVEVKYLDRQNNFNPVSIVKQRAAVISGAEMPRRAVYDMQSIAMDSGTADRLSTNLLNLAWDDTTFEWEADRSALATQIWDVVALTGTGLSAQDVRVRSIKAKGERFVIAGTEYHDASYSDVVQQSGSPLSAGSIGTPDPNATPPDISSGSVTWTEELFQQQANHALSRGILAFTLPAYSYFEAVEVWVTPPSGGASKYWYETTRSPSVTPTLWETGNYTLVLYVRSISQKRSSGTTVVVAVNGVTGSVPEITSPNSTIPGASSTDHNAQSFIWFSAPASYNFVREYRVYDTRGANPMLYDTIPKDAIPTSTKPFNVTAIVSRTFLAWDTAGSNTLSVKVTVVSMAGVESTGTTISSSNSQAATGGQDPHVPQTGSTLSLSNGLNSNIATATPRPGLLEITGPTAAFSIGGFTAPQNGERLRLFNTTSQSMTIVNEDASSTAANRIVNPFAANMVLAAGNSFVDLEYSAVKSRFVVKSTLDSIGAGGGGLEKITSLNPTAPAFRGTGSAAALPRGVLLNQSTVLSTTDVDIVNITGKGMLRFLSVGVSSAGGPTPTPILTLIIDGVTIINAQAYTAFNNSASATPGLYEAIIGAILGGYDANALTYDASATFADSGITFRSSLIIRLRGSSIAASVAVCFAYALY